MSERLLITGGSGFIGTHLIETISRSNNHIINLDIRPPAINNQIKYWQQCDIKDLGVLDTAFDEFKPTRVIHLAAKANLNGQTVNDFPDNTEGTANLVEIINKTDSVRMFVNTSTQYVIKPGICPADDLFHKPYTAYGASKAAAERIVREKCTRCWTIIRPTNIWGPGHAFFPYELWRYLESGYYMHPGFRPIKKYYGYVSNAVDQILNLALSENPALVSGKTWYIADGSVDNAEWMNGFSLGLRGKKIHRIPLHVWWGMAKIGDFLNSVGIRFPVNSERMFRLTVNETIPEDKILKTDPGSFISFEEGVRRSIAWYLAISNQKKNNPYK